MATPRALQEGDTIAIASPAGAVDPALIDGAARLFEAEGWRVRVMPHAGGRRGTYSGTPEERLADMAEALLDRSVRAVLCGRGGYGAVHLLEGLDALPLEADPKWLIGFSDICALHGLMASKGIASVHGPMARHLQTPSPQSRALCEILRGGRPPMVFDAHPLNRPGEACGMLRGGNLAVLSGLVGTKYDLLLPGSILFIEDVNEPIYKLERMLWQLRLRGVLPALRGLVVGQFAGTEPDANYASAYDMVSEMTAGYAYPVAYNAPIGHRFGNTPVIVGIPYRLTVSDQVWLG